MSKEEFLAELRSELSGLPEEDLEERITFYREMLDDRMDAGQTEEEAVAGIEPVDQIVSQIMSEIPLGKLVGEKVRQRRRLKGWEIALLILGAPLWLPLLIAALAVVLSLYVVPWAAVVSFWAAELGLAAAAVGCIIGAVPFLQAGNLPAAGTAAGAGLFCAGLAVLFFHACRGITGAVIRLGAGMLTAVKRLFVGED